MILQKTCKYKILTALFLMISGLLFSQNVKKDSSYVNEKLRLSKLADKYYNTNYRKAIPILHQQRVLMEKYKDTTGLIELNNRLIWLFSAQIKNIDSTEVYLEKLQKDLTNIKSQELLGSVYTRIGFAYQTKGYYRLAMKNYLRSIDVKESLSSIGSLAFSYNLVGKVYDFQEQYENSLHFHRKAIHYRKQLKTNWQVAHSYNNIAIAFRKSGELDSAMIYCEKALAIRKKSLKKQSSKFHYALALKNRGKIYTELKDYNKAITNFNEAIKFGNSPNRRHFVISVYYGLASSYLKLKNYPKVISYLKKSDSILEISPIETPQRIIGYDLLSQYYYQTGKFKKAFDVKNIQDSLQYQIKNIALLKSSEELQKMYSAEKRDKIIAELGLKNTVIKNESQKQRNQKNIITIILLVSLIGLIGLTLFFIDRNKQAKLLNQKNQIITKSLNEKNLLLKEIHHRIKNSFQIVSSLLYLQSQNIKDKQAFLAISDAQERVNSMALLHQKLYQNDTLTDISTKEYIQDLVNNIIQTHHNFNTAKIKYNIDDFLLNIETMTPIGLIINELIVNVIKHAYPEENAISKKILITFKKNIEGILLSVKDNGIGLKNKNTNTFGMKLINLLAKKLEANVEILVNKGTEVRLQIKKTTKL